MNQIQILPKKLVAKIAAGEVVERPASVLKELLENSFDAGATDIKIVIEQAGSRKIVVTDNGHGMDRNNIRLAAHPHATSKIKTEHDLTKIGTFGFRGEALASIAAVSQLTILSKTASEDIGTKITATNGTITDPIPAGSPTGTTVIVETLFSQTPARKKFLKTPNTELRHIIQAVTHAALAHPTIAFTLTHNGQTILDLPRHIADAPHVERIQRIVGDRIAADLVPITRNSPHIGIAGLIGKPQTASREKNRQFLFINGRPVTNVRITQAVKSAYGNLLEPKMQPTFVLYLDIPLESVDVNIHPRKETVQFVNENTITEVLTRSVEQSLHKNDLTYTIRDENESSLMLRDSGMDVYTASVLKKMVQPWQLAHGNNERETEIIQLHNLYLVAETASGILLIDQHAAHERILYEQFKAAFRQTQAKPTAYTLPQALVFDLPLIESVQFENHASTFKQLGFDIEPFGDTTFKVRSVPMIFKDRDSVALITEVLEDLNQKNIRPEIDSESDRTLSYLACRSAIKAGDYITPDERKNLLAKLADTTGSYTCPHGRPTHIEISLAEFDRMFKRI